ncbi:hypothetical protein [Lyngbya sp. CCY1209]|uniref:hypothetical protein n=1 Tax=Lyngbya sp. CCY1209 TaxID=2886103 RepID=UPI002D21226B|nr:hypothetical protein [Lyngbya sp. CCY1209]MEB3885069.1 hypothetical protein [Lyngbya sp. CCY1209]
MKRIDDWVNEEILDNLNRLKEFSDIIRSILKIFQYNNGKQRRELDGGGKFNFVNQRIDNNSSDRLI